MTERIIVGERYGEYGLWISKPGTSAWSTDRTGFLVYNSMQHLHVHMSGTIGSSGSVFHGLGYVPIVQASPSSFSTSTAYRLYIDANYITASVSSVVISYTIYKTPINP